MQTFLPFRDYALSAKSLDNLRLGKQRVETLQILNVLTGRSEGWQNHPAVRMWAGHERSLCIYGMHICDEWFYERSFADTVGDKIRYIAAGLSGTTAPPWWVGNEEFHRSHQSNLIRKDAAHYVPQFPGVPPDLPYWWPTHHQKA
jgi:Pyrimidine dimer DNA glycosylase